MELDRTSAKRTIRYLKRGLFPPNSIEHFTAGREREAQYIAGALGEVQQGASRHCFVVANYGFGKSHMLKVAESLALQRGFAVSWVTINGADHAFNHPTRYLHSILGNLRVPKHTGRGLTRICSHWLANSERVQLLTWAHSAPWEMRCGIDYLSKLGSDKEENYREWYISYLEGRDLKHKSGTYYYYDFYKRIEATISLCNAMGCSGLLFLFDEIECIATQLRNIRSRLLSYQILRCLAKEDRFPHAMFLFAATEDFGWKVIRDASYIDDYQRSYPEGFDFILEWCSEKVSMLRIKAITKDDNRKLLSQIRWAHGVAYDWSPANRVSDAFIDSYLEVVANNESSQRAIVKCFVELLEVAQQHRGAKIADFTGK